MHSLAEINPQLFVYLFTVLFNLGLHFAFVRLECLNWDRDWILHYPCPEKRRNSSCRRKMVLVNIVENFIVQRDEVFNLRFRHAILGCRDISESM